MNTPQTQKKVASLGADEGPIKMAITR